MITQDKNTDYLAWVLSDSYRTPDDNLDSTATRSEDDVDPTEIIEQFEEKLHDSMKPNFEEFDI